MLVRFGLVDDVEGHSFNGVSQGGDWSGENWPDVCLADRHQSDPSLAALQTSLYVGSRISLYNLKIGINQIRVEQRRRRISPSGFM